ATRSQFFRAAAESMRRILVDHARRKRADKRGGGGKRFELAEGDRGVVPDPVTLLSIAEGLAELAAEDPAPAAGARRRRSGRWRGCRWRRRGPPWVYGGRPRPGTGPMPGPGSPPP